MTIRRADTTFDIVGSAALASDGYSLYLSTTLVSTTSGTKTIVINLPSDGEGILFGKDHPVNSGDVAYLSGTSGSLADGYYIIDQVVDDLTFTVLPPIATSTGGNVNFYFPVGAGTVGFDPTGLTITNSHNVQGAIKDIDLNAVTNTSHETLRQLIHFLDEGPGDGFASGAYKETIGHPFTSTIIWYTDSTKSKIIVSKTIIRNAIQIPITITWEVYKVDGTTVAHTVTDTISYISNVFESSRTRAIT